MKQCLTTIPDVKFEIFGQFRKQSITRMERSIVNFLGKKDTFLSIITKPIMITI